MPTAVLTAYQVRGNVESLWRSFVTTELVSLLGYWLLCWMSTGRTKKGLMWRTHTPQTKNIKGGRAAYVSNTCMWYAVQVVCCYHINSTPQYNAVRGRRTGFNNSGVEEISR